MRKEHPIGLSTSSLVTGRQRREQKNRVAKRRLLAEELEGRWMMSGNTDNWIGGSTGDWSVGANWDNGVPTSSSNVVIGSNVSVTISGNPGDTRYANSITTNSGDALSITGGTLMLGSGASVLGNTTVANGAALDVANNVPIQLQDNTNFIDFGSVTLSQGDVVMFDTTNYYATATQLIVAQNGSTAGVLQATGTTFASQGSETTQILVNSGGNLQATDCTFDRSLSAVGFDPNAIWNPNDLQGNRFDCLLVMPFFDVQNLAGPVGNRNVEFFQVNILGGEMTAGQSLTLNALNTISGSQYDYLFAGNFTVDHGATVNVGTNVPIQLQDNTNFIDFGSVTLSQGDVVMFDTTNYYATATQLIVAQNGSTAGVLQATGTTFASQGSETTQILVNSGGNLQATDCTFDRSLSAVGFDPNAIWNPNDLQGNRFDCLLVMPFFDVQNLAGPVGNRNVEFFQVNILGGEMTAGQSLTLNALNTISGSQYDYLFAGNFTVDHGATVNVGTNVPIQLQDNTNFIDFGSVTLSQGDVVMFDTTNYYATATQLIVAQNGSTAGVLQATGTTFASQGSETTQILVNSGGMLNITDGSIATSSVALASGSYPTLNDDILSTQLDINSGSDWQQRQPAQHDPEQ